MIYYIDGKIVIKKKDFVVIETAGIGYKVFMSPDAVFGLPEEGKKFKLYCHLSVGRDSETLYGFPSKENLEFFESLVNLSGIGPKTAVQVASIAPMDVLKEGIQKNDEEIIRKIFAIGKSKGQRVIFELSRKIQNEPEGDDAFSTLCSLGFSKKDSLNALKNVSKDKSIDERVKEALKILDR